MYIFLAYLLFALLLMMAMATPFAPYMKKKHKKFCLYWMVLYIAQLFMYPPGSDISPYAYATGTISTMTKFAGLTLSAISSIILLAFVTFDLCFKKRPVSKKELLIFICVIIPSVIALGRSDDVGESLDVMIKAIAPFEVYFWLKSIINKENAVYFRKVIDRINILMIGQVILCKVLTGATNAYNYYYELTEEFFGYYNHPHSFTSLLWILSIFNVYQVAKNRKVKKNIVLLGANLLCIFGSGVRTYLAALGVGLIFIGLWSLWNKNGQKLRKYVIFSLIVLIFVGPTLIGYVGAGRDYISTDVSSGRFVRWSADIMYFMNTFSMTEKLIGGGANSSYVANQTIFGVYINSLNLVIDLLLDYGIIGMVLMLFSYTHLFTSVISRDNKIFIRGIGASFITACVINSPVTYVPTMLMLIVLLLVIQNEESTIKNKRLLLKLRRSGTD